MSSRYVQPLRIAIQIIFMIIVLRLGYQLYHFVQMVHSGEIVSSAVRPDGIDGFLPISGLMGTASWMKGGGINSIHPAAVIIFITVIVISLVLRRSFCSWICPIATVSEVSWKSGFHLFRRSFRLPLWLDRAFRSLKYLLLCFFVYSIVIVMSPGALNRFIQSDYHKIADVRLLYFFLHMSLFSCTIIVFLLAVSILNQNPFCRYLCPYGALLGLVSVFSPLRVTRNIDRCVSCGVCSQVCPTQIDVMHSKEVISPECIACWRCVSHCRFNEALSMRLFRRIKVPGFIFAALVIILFYGGIIIGKISGNWHSSVSIEEYVRLLGK